MPVAAVAAVTMLTADQMVSSLEKEIANWSSNYSNKFKFNTGHGGPAAGGKTRMDVGITTGDFATALAAVEKNVSDAKAKASYVSPGGKQLLVLSHNQSYSGGANVKDLVLSEEGKSSNDFGIKSINYHIMIK